MRILYLAHRVPDAPTKGEKIRAFHQIRALAARHEVEVWALDDDPDRSVDPLWKDEVSAVRVMPLGAWGARCRVLGALLGGASLSSAHFADRRIRAAVRDRLRGGDFDLCMTYSGAIDPWADGFRPRVLDLVDVDSAKFQAYHRERSVRGPKRWLFGLEGARLAALERDAVADADLTLVCTEVEAELLRSFAQPRRLEVVGNGVDLDAFPFAGGEGRQEGEILFVGALDYQANVEAVTWLVRDILPRIQRERPGVRVTLVGSRPTPAVRRLESDPAVAVAADVPSVLPFLHRATLTVQPFRVARGIQNKALEALSAGLPVVTTPGPAKALGGRPGRELEVEDGADGLAAKTVSLLAEPDRREKMALAGRSMVEAHFSWPAVLRRYVDLVEEVGGYRPS